MTGAGAGAADGELAGDDFLKREGRVGLQVADEDHLAAFACAADGEIKRSARADDLATLIESCDHCHTYRKIFYQEKDLYVEPVADDLASLALDVLMGEAGYSRASGNPLLWHGAEEE